MSQFTPPVKTPVAGVPPEYRGLNKYLRDRFADTVVLRFAEIEGLLGFALPDLARVRADWWSSPAGSGAASPQACSWIQADRTARPNLLAKTVMFERA
jgi:hypothetical protein